ncbi:hypothetical protein COT97_01280 [Candidatus Falkowbacteria bacterium CG10_big_fil_rev_8_21_14_0_10_39_11]|uniref:Uncharacterized protein n=1 Tax=Candidatus Falkowbacteria bacterium CG10_big_fil_rev_8_21_14_0_10_39_11 TaxID=1974565 RepID=A0A2H0V5X0_9BACT|nr:MAG: hypothetical protein COT97_01280 [Candidatus Falkowbacteria bacterium CG10_big_fil_rev_8_21_14_0_10_39_11]
MKITIKVTTNAKKVEVIKLDRANYQVKLVSTPIEGKANAELIKILAKYFNTAKSNINIVQGIRAKIKIVEVLV